MDPPQAQGRRRRAPKACVFCRQRKMKCSNERPRCMNCIAYEQECVFVEAPKKSRPSKARILHLEEENRKLQARLASTASTPSSDESQSVKGEGSNVNSPRQTELSPSQSPQLMCRAYDPLARDDKWNLSSIGRVSALDSSGWNELFQQSQTRNPTNGESVYYSLAGALLNDSFNRNEVGQGWENPKLPTRHVREQLMAEAARQRQLEAINFNFNRLDFDGVDRDIGLQLLTRYWNLEHQLNLFVYRPAFMRDMACGGRYFSKLLLNAIFFTASVNFSESPAVQAAHESYRQRFKELLAPALDRSEITTIQALLIMSEALLATDEDRCAAFMYEGMAFRMINDFHAKLQAQSNTTPSQLSVEEMEIRRRVFWGAFVADKLRSLYQGRPISFENKRWRVPLAFLDDFEEMELWMPLANAELLSYPGYPTYSVTTFTSLCKLSQVINCVYNKLYTEDSLSYPTEQLANIHKLLQAKLQYWHRGLPSHLRYDYSDATQTIPPPHVLSLLITYHLLIIQLHRPFNKDGFLHAKLPSVALNSFDVCVTASKDLVGLLRAYDRAFGVANAPFLIFYATYVSAIFLVREATQSTGSEAVSCLDTCLTLMGRNEKNAHVRAAKAAVLDLMGVLGVPFDRRGSSDVGHTGSSLHPSPVQSRQLELNATPMDIAVHNPHDAVIGHNLAFTTDDNFRSRLAAGPDFDVIINNFIRGFNSEATVSEDDSDASRLTSPHATPAPRLEGSREMILAGHSPVDPTLDEYIRTHSIDASANPSVLPFDESTLHVGW
ncbi:hypothetical protein L228DRAFT_143329 [Xylona heveae TC161]|uniref:Zn(2)-C6 fungal-type domain-containing protein n=1 Tax=Xylona heveae (strain CBS 132557 / TC161) TaxID=1328760 RepID=A0A165H7I3_XYLHT|nr:hypothetical protein L228DRAFT_143329 [Xylona heveae TC161]KZF23092.1 hypothetical protein L228DRAFT_143329 [Xylona heveae TC161]